MATNNSISAYSGYTFVIPEKFTLSMTTSFETGRSYNYGPSIYFEVDGKRIGLTYDDLLDLNDEIEKMLSLARNIPHTENHGIY
jgi:hypothetical protein